MNDQAEIEKLVHAIATAIQAKDEHALSACLAPDFILRRPGASALSAAEFVAGVRELPFELVFVRIEQLVIDLNADAALATGVQHSQVRVDDGGQAELVDDHQPFIDWFVKDAGSWKLRVALDLSDS